MTGYLIGDGSTVHRNAAILGKCTYAGKWSVRRLAGSGDVMNGRIRIFDLAADTVRHVSIVAWYRVRHIWTRAEVRVPKELHIFTAADGADAHGQINNLTLMQQVVFD